MHAVFRQQHVVASLMSEPGFQLSCVDYLLGYSTPAAAASHSDNASFSFQACTLLFVLHSSIS